MTDPDPELPPDAEAQPDPDPIERPPASRSLAPELDPEAPGAALVDPTVEQAEPNEPA